MFHIVMLCFVPWWCTLYIHNHVLLVFNILFLTYGQYFMNNYYLMVDKETFVSAWTEVQTLNSTFNMLTLVVVVILYLKCSLSWASVKVSPKIVGLIWMIKYVGQAQARNDFWVLEVLMEIKIRNATIESNLIVEKELQKFI